MQSTMTTLTSDDAWKEAAHIFNQDSGIDLIKSKDIEGINSEHSLLLALDDRLQNSVAYKKQKRNLLDSLRPVCSFCTYCLALVVPTVNNVSSRVPMGVACTHDPQDLDAAKITFGAIGTMIIVTVSRSSIFRLSR